MRTAEHLKRQRIIITPPRRFSLPAFSRLWEAREVLWRFAARDIVLRYRQTALGVVWVVLQPLLGAGVLSFVFGKVAKVSTDQVPPIVFTFAGFLAWTVFTGIVSRGSTSLVANAALVSKVFFPRMLVPLSTAGSVMVDFTVSLVVMGALLGTYGIAPSWAIVLLPVWLVLLVCLAGGVALVTSALMVSYRDVQYVVPFILQILLYASPVAYAVPTRYKVFYDINPLTWLFGDVRWSLLNQPRPDNLYLSLSIVVPVLVLFAGAFIFQQMERGFADYI